MGEIAHLRSEFVILTDCDPGLEDPREIIQVSWFVNTLPGEPNLAHGFLVCA
jgi:hypothetical protein